MPDHKRQHYVPRCYLKPFSLNGEGVAINLYNITCSRAIRNASVKGQCAKDYLYGNDLKLERRLQDLEGEYARILRALQNATDEPTQQDLDVLRGFAYLQHARTDMAIRRMRMMREGLHNAMYEGRPVTSPDLDLSDRAMMRDSMFMYAKAHEQIEDLKVCIVKNDTHSDFITSDDPAILTSRFYIQRMRRRTFGLGSSGAVFFLPLTPRLLMMSYDSDVYTIPGKTGCFVSITDQRDVFALNELQFLKAAENIYFSRWDYRDQVEQEFCEVSPQRPETWCEYSVFVLDGFTETGQRYRLATEEERRTARETVIMMSTLHPAPSRWLSKLRFRSRIRTYSDGSSAGHVRKRIWDSRSYRGNLDSP